MHCNVDLSTTQQSQGQAESYSFLITKKAQNVEKTQHWISIIPWAICGLTSDTENVRLFKSIELYIGMSNLKKTVLPTYRCSFVLALGTWRKQSGKRVQSSAHPSAERHAAHASQLSVPAWTSQTVGKDLKYKPPRNNQILVPHKVWWGETTHVISNNQHTFHLELSLMSITLRSSFTDLHHMPYYWMRQIQETNIWL